MAINSYAQLGPYIDSILSANGDLPIGPPHKNFWTLTYQEFTTGNVPNVVDPITHQPMKILVVGNSSASNLIQALEGKAGSLFDPNNPNGIGQMPRFGTPWTATQIKPIADWIDANCPQ
jgi:hypothetical protein